MPSIIPILSSQWLAQVLVIADVNAIDCALVHLKKKRHDHPSCLSLSLCDILDEGSALQIANGNKHGRPLGTKDGNDDGGEMDFKLDCKVVCKLGCELDTDNDTAANDFIKA